MSNHPIEAEEQGKPLHFDAYESGDGPGAAVGIETEDINLTIVAWPEHFSVPPHVNTEVDVVTIVLSGIGKATVDGKEIDLRLGSVLVVPKGSERSIKSLSVDFRYVSVHKRRRRLMPQIHNGRNG
ncbi:MAG TPA: cupin domain-containing protein [Fimbriimonadaceae bacterium]|nr:cupin domain-containing protein [Fimbriimonadaceae bacterium]